MPIYEFTCINCNRTFETIVSLGAEKTVLCPACGSNKIQKRHSTFGIGGGSDRTRSQSSSCASCSASSCETCK